MGQRDETNDREASNSENSAFKNFILKNKIESILILTMLFGFIFRVINAETRIVLGDPFHFIINAINYLNSGLLSLWDQSSFLWYAVTDIAYKFFGITQFASRFSSVLFGTFTILAIYLFVKEISGNKKIALISAILYAFGPTFIFNAADEHDISTLFFIVCAFYTLIKGLNKNSNKYLFISAAFLGIACMWKFYVPIFIIPYAGMIIYYHRKGRFDIKKEYKTLAILAIIILIMNLPVLAYNYLNYEHNGVPTFFFTKFITGVNSDKINNLYGWVSGGELFRKGSFLSRVFVSEGGGTSELYKGITYSLYSNGPFLWALSILGLIWMFIRRKSDKFAKDYLIFYALYFVIPFLFLIDSNYLSKHYIQFLAFALPFIAYGIYSLYEMISKKMNKENMLEGKEYYLFMAVLVFVFFVVLSLPFNGESFFTKNPEKQFMEFKSNNIGTNSLIIYDERIYNSMAGWLFNDRYFISTTNLGQFMEYNQKSQFTQKVPVYFVECMQDSCGWAVSPELNASSEAFFEHIKTNLSAKEVSTVYTKLKGDRYYNPLISSTDNSSFEQMFKVYRLDLPIDLNIAKQFKNQYEYFLYPLGYENKQTATFKNFIYTPSGAFEKLLNSCAWLVFYLEIILSFLAVLFVIYEFYFEV